MKKQALKITYSFKLWSSEMCYLVGAFFIIWPAPAKLFWKGSTYYLVLSDSISCLVKNHLDFYCVLLCSKKNSWIECQNLYFRPCPVLDIPRHSVANTNFNDMSTYFHIKTRVSKEPAQCIHLCWRNPSLKCILFIGCSILWNCVRVYTRQIELHNHFTELNSYLSIK